MTKTFVTSRRRTLQRRMATPSALFRPSLAAVARSVHADSKECLVSDHAIDEAILSLLSAGNGRWKKVAMVISRVADAMGKDLPEGDDGYEQIARRVEVLVCEGRLVLQGDIKNWRFSEVRRPN